MTPTSAQHATPSGGNTSSRQDQLEELRMQMMHIQSKKEELKQTFPTVLTMNRFRAELLSVATKIKRLGGSN